MSLTFFPVVGKIGYYLPFSVAGAILIAIGNGLLATLSPSTSTGKWIGYQILIGVGRGIGLQMVRINSSVAQQNVVLLTDSLS